MGKESEDKAERILSLYTRLKEGKVINKEQEANELGVSPRTIQRDISDIQCFLQNQNAESGEVQEIVFDKNVHITTGRKLIGQASYPLAIAKGTKI